MDVRSLRQIIAVQRHGSFAKAAEALGLSQPNLSRSIARLEDQLQVKLFDRGALGAELTPIGELIVQRASGILAEIDNLVHDTALVAGGEAGQVRLGFGGPLRDVFLPRLLVKIADQHPKLNVVVEVNNADRLLPLLDSRELDLIFSAFAPNMADREYVISDIVKSSQIIVAAPSHPLASQRSIKLQRLTEFRCAGTYVQSFRNDVLFANLGDGPNLSAYMSNDFNALIALARASDVVLIAPELALREALRDGTLVQLDIDWTVEVAYVAVATRAATYSPILNRIRGYAQELGTTIRDEAAPPRS